MKLLLSSIVLVTLTVFTQSSVDNESNLRVLKSAKVSKTPKSVKSVKVEKPAKRENTKAAKSEKDVKSVKSRPCPDGIIVVDDNFIKTENLDQEAIEFYDTSLVTNMSGLFAYSDVSADLSSWDVSSVTEMYVSFHFS